MINKPVSEAMWHDFEQTPVGWIGGVGSGAGLRSLIIGSNRDIAAERIYEIFPRSCLARKGVVATVFEQLGEYFAGRRRTFDVPLDLRGLSDFSLGILKTLRQVPFGETVTYGQLALRGGRPRAARAVGRVMACNPLPLVLPCHRVVGAGDSLTGYSGGNGVATKQWLLEFEQKFS